MKENLKRLALILPATLAFGCTDHELTRPSDDSHTPSYSTSFAASEAAIRSKLPSGPIGHTDLFRAAAGVESWFGGLYIENGVVKIVTTDSMVERSQARSFARGLLRVAGREDLAIRAEGAQLTSGNYSFAELSDWLAQIKPFLPQFELTYIDINEVNNTVEFRTDSDGAASGLRKAIEDMGIPSDVVTIGVQDRIELLHNMGGRQVAVSFSTHDSYPTECTLTQVVEHRTPENSLDPYYYGITNSHCTESFASNTDDIFEYQNSAIADEVWDHPLITNSDCVALTGKTSPECRYSDAALFKYRSTYSGTLYEHDVDMGFWSMGLEGESMVFVGETVYKRGNATGTTSGTVMATCIDGVASNGVGLLCQYKADLTSDNGDSGSPVFVQNTVGSEVKYQFTGILWGGEFGVTYFSRADRLAREIVPDDGTDGQDWGTICLSHSSQYCWY